jgi:hypothetical protein
MSCWLTGWEQEGTWIHWQGAVPTPPRGSAQLLQLLVQLLIHSQVNSEVGQFLLHPGAQYSCCCCWFSCWSIHRWIVRWASSYSTQGLSTAVAAAGSAADPFTGEQWGGAVPTPPRGSSFVYYWHILKGWFRFLPVIWVYRYFIAQAFRDYLYYHILSDTMGYIIVFRRCCVSFDEYGTYQVLNTVQVDHCLFCKVFYVKNKKY